MTHYEVSYKGLDRAAADDKAIADIIDYIGQEKFDLFVANAHKGADFVNIAFGMHSDPDPGMTDEQGFEVKGEGA